MFKIKEIQKLSLRIEEIRFRLLEVIYNSQSGHIGGDLSALNVLAVLYLNQMNISPESPDMENRDRFILSKGHCVEALYCVLEASGFISSQLLDSYGTFKSKLVGHPSNKISGIEFSGGSLGHGLSLGVGVAIGAKMNNNNFKTYVMMGDGELGEGSIYEAAMAGGHFKLDNLIGIIDRNRLQISNTTEKVMTLEPLRERWESLGWEVLEMNGDEVDDIIKTFEQLVFDNGKPCLIISHTTKGKGVSFMENVLKWHHGVPSPEQYRMALQEITQRIDFLKVLLN